MGTQLISQARRLEESIRQGGVEQANDLGRLVDLLTQVNTHALPADSDEDEQLTEDAVHVKDGLALLHGLRRSFELLLSRGDLRRGKSPSTCALSPLDQYKAWVEQKYTHFLSIMAQWIERPNAVCQVAALRTLMFFVSRDCQRVDKNKPRFGDDVFKCVVGAIARSATTGGLKGQVLRVFNEEYLESYMDVRNQTLICIRELCTARISTDPPSFEDGISQGWLESGSVDPFVFCDNVFNLLYLVEFTAEKRKGDAYWLVPETERRAPMKKKTFQRAWVSFLRLPGLPRKVYRKILLALPNRVVANLSNPLILSDFLTDACNVGGVTSVMALRSLFQLIVEHDLDYPEFFTKLYGMMDVGTFHAKHRAQFFELLNQVLDSTHLASYLVAAFAKKIARLAILAPPSSAMFAVVLLSNLLKKHPTCLTLVHRPTLLELDMQAHAQVEEQDVNQEKRAKLESIKEASLRMALGGERRATDRTDESRKRKAEDPFDPLEVDPAKTRAVESCLWEIEALSRHYSPNVSLLVQNLFYTELKETIESRKVPPPLPMDEFFTVTYKSLFDQEMRKKKKRAALTFQDIHASAASPPCLRVRSVIIILDNYPTSTSQRPRDVISFVLVLGSIIHCIAQTKKPRFQERSTRNSVYVDSSGGSR